MTDEPKLPMCENIKVLLQAYILDRQPSVAPFIEQLMLRFDREMAQRTSSIESERDALRAQLEAIFSHAGLWRIATMLESCARVSPHGDVEIRTEEVHDALAAARDAAKGEA